MNNRIIFSIGTIIMILAFSMLCCCKPRVGGKNRMDGLVEAIDSNRDGIISDEEAMEYNQKCIDFAKGK